MDVRFDPHLETLVASGDTIAINSHILKTGQNVAFCRMEAVHLESGSLLASGTHTKFMPMPFPWDLVMHPTVQPYAVRFMDPMASPFGENGDTFDTSQPIDDCFRLRVGKKASGCDCHTCKGLTKTRWKQMIQERPRRRSRR
eukprot:scaffold7033_cov257-Pinguiococcus_pyrenoidosus.AAC.32